MVAFSIIAWIIFIILCIKDGASNFNYKINDQAKAKKEGRPYYWDNKGKIFSVRTGEEVTFGTEYGLRDPKTGLPATRNCIRSAKDRHIVDYIGDYHTK